MASSRTNVTQLVALGIPKPKALYALQEFDGNAEVAADWCFTEGAEWTPNDLLQTSHVRPTSALSAESSTLDLSRVDPRTSTSSPARSGSGSHNHTPPGWTLVPARDVTPGTKVSITLKQDQGTERTVEGVVAERLTRGDHPRGVKVRLRDGRVGRVVRILDARNATIRLHGTRIGEVDLASDPRNWLPPRMSAFASTSTSTATATATAGSRQDLDDACDACLLACSTCSPQPVDSCCPLPLPLPPLSQPPLSPCSQFFQDCQACASQGQGGGEVAASHLAFCCDDEGCLPHGGDDRDKGKRVERDYQAPWDHTWLDDCAQCVGDHHRAPPPSQPPLGAIALEPHHDVTANGLGLVDDASCCSTPWLDHSDAAMFEDCRNAGCFDLPPESSHASTSSIDSLSTLATSIEGPLQGNEAHSVDLDGLLTGLDNSTIQDILNCCCCDEARHEQPGTFDPSSHANHQRLPQHIHCDEHHPARLPHFPSHCMPHSSGLGHPAYHPPPHPPPNGACHQARPTLQHMCGWSGCHMTFLTPEELALHVNSTHLLLTTASPDSPGLPSQASEALRSEPASQSGTVGESHLLESVAAAAALQQVPLGQLAQLDPVTALAIFSSVISNRSGAGPPPASTSPGLPHPPAMLTRLPNPSSTHRHVHSHSASRGSRRHVHSHPYGVASIRKHSHVVPPSPSRSCTPSNDERFDYASAPSRESSPSTMSSPPPRAAPHACAPFASGSATTGASSIVATVPLSPPSASRSSPPPAAAVHVCRWRSCGLSFPTSSDLMEHLSIDHIGSGKARYTCEWEGCDRSTRACDERHDGDAERDKKAFRQRQKVMRHLQMHTGDRPFACGVCGKTFSESLTLTQHMRVHTQERPYVCDHPGCDKAFALASALTIHKRTHTGDRPFACPHPGCNAAFAESSNLSKHVRIHTSERRFVCQVAGCGKAFGRSDQLKRHGKTHDKAKNKARKGGGGGGGDHRGSPGFD
ncbi:hypothetical protein JCM3766R1_006948 [Sporobolomyces carnicolor]